MNRIDRIEEAGGSFDLCGKVIELAMKVRRSGFEIKTERLIEVVYAGEIVGTFAADLLVNGRLIAELKATQCLLKVYEVQLVNYLTATSVDEGLLLNFGGCGSSTKKSSECTIQSQ